MGYRQHFRSRRGCGRPTLAATVLLQCLLCGATPLSAAESSSTQEVGSETNSANELAVAVFEIFYRRCVGCHGPDHQKSGLRLDSHDAVVKPNAEDAVVLAGTPERSRLLTLIQAEGTDRMPPKGRRLEPAEIATIKQWITAGAPAPRELTSAAGARRALTLRSQQGWWELPIVALAASPDGTELAVARGETVSVQRAAHTEHARKRTAHRFLRSPSGWVEALAYSPGGDLLALGGYRTVELWSPKGNAQHPAQELGPHVEAVTALAFDPTGRRLYAGGGIPTRQGEVKLWDTESGKLVRTVEDHTDTVYALAASGDGKYFASGSADRRVLLYDATTGALVQRFFGHSHYVTALTFAPDSGHLYSASVDGNIKEWSFDAPNAQRTLKGHEGAVCAILVAQDAKTLYSAGQDRTVRLWKREDGSALHTFTVAGSAPIHAAALLGNRRVAAVAGGLSVVHLLSTVTGAPEGTLRPTRRL